MKRLLFCMTLFAAIGVFAGKGSERAAFRTAVNKGNIQAACRKGLKHRDEAIRRYALARLYLHDNAAGLKAAVETLNDSSPEVRKLAIKLIGHHPTLERQALLKKSASNDQDAEVRAAAKKALWPFHRNNILLKDDPAWDYLVKMVKHDSLAQYGWRSVMDPEGKGHIEGWCNSDFDDGVWEKTTQENSKRLTTPGIIWYRCRFPAEPPKKFNSFEIVLPKVAGSCCAWLNGIYLGQRDSSEAISEVRFNAGAEVQPGKENVMVIRVDGSAQGGILSPASAEWME